MEQRHRHAGPAGSQGLLAATIFAGLAYGIFFAALHGTHWPRDYTDLVVGRDFLNFWWYGRAAWGGDPARFYDPAVYNDAVQALLGPYPWVNWAYPPCLLLPAAPFGLLPYGVALLLWTLLGIGALGLALRPWIGTHKALLAVALSPAFYFCLLSGQNAFFTTALMLGSFYWLARRPTLAGMLIGLFVFKPQLALLYPVMLVAARRWRVLAVAALTACVLVLATAALYGWQVWHDYISIALPVQRSILERPDNAKFMPSVFAGLRIAGLAPAQALCIQSLFTLAGAGWVFVAFRRMQADRWESMALFFACSAMATPYLMYYDLLPLSVMAVIGLGRKCGRGEAVILHWLYWCPLANLLLGHEGIAGSALVLPLAAWLAWRRGKEERSG